MAACHVRRPHDTDLPWYERHTDLRVYTIPAWRRVRQFGARTVIDLVRDSVAVSLVHAHVLRRGWAVERIRSMTASARPAPGP